MHHRQGGTSEERPEEAGEDTAGSHRQEQGDGVNLDRASDDDRMQHVALELLDRDVHGENDQRRRRAGREQRDERRDSADKERTDDRHERAEERQDRERHAMTASADPTITASASATAATPRR